MKYVFKKIGYNVLALTLDVLGTVFFSFRFILNKKLPLNPRKIILIRLDHIGDFVCSTPLFENVRLAFPQAEVTLLTTPMLKDLAKNDPFLDRIWLHPGPPWLRRGKKKIFLISRLFRLLKEMRKEKFDLGFDSRGDIFSILLMYLGGVKYKVGYGITGGGFLLDKEVRYEINSNSVERNINLLKELKIAVRKSSPKVYFSDKDEKFVEVLLDKMGFRNTRSLVLHPFAGVSAKQWPEEKFRTLIKKLNHTHWKVALVGSVKDSASYSDVYDLRGKLSLPQLACLIKKIGFFIGLDSGPANIALALNVPAVIICSGTNIPERWLPESENALLIYKDVPCKPCEQEICSQPRHYCMEEIEVGEILKAVDGWLG